MTVQVVSDTHTTHEHTETHTTTRRAFRLRFGARAHI